MPTGVPELLASGSSVANTAFDSGVLPVNSTTGNLLILISASAPPAAGNCILSDDTGRVLFTGALAGFGYVIVLGNDEGSPVVASLSTGAVPAMVATGAVPGGKGQIDQRPKGLRVQIDALGVGIVGRFGIIGEIPRNL